MLLTSCERQIRQMATGKSLLRVGDIWYGTDRWTTVSGFSYFAQKNVKTLQVIRAESAISFSNSMPPIDTVQAELVIHYTRVKSHIQRLMASLLVTPILPVMNPVVAALTMPIGRNRELYAAYGIPTEELMPESDNRPASFKQVSHARQMEIYSSVPVQMRVEFAQVSTISEVSRDLRVILKFIRVSSANSYGDRPFYIVNEKGVVLQEEYIRRLQQGGGDTAQVDAFADIIGVNAGKYRYMIKAMQAVMNNEGLSSLEEARDALITEKPSGDEGRTTYLPSSGNVSAEYLLSDPSYPSAEQIAKIIGKDLYSTYYLRFKDPASSTVGDEYRNVIYRSPFLDPTIDLMLCLAFSSRAPRYFFTEEKYLRVFVSATRMAPLCGSLIGYTGSDQKVTALEMRWHRSISFPAGRIIGSPSNNPLDPLPEYGRDANPFIQRYRSTVESFLDEVTNTIKAGGGWEHTARSQYHVGEVIRRILLLLYDHGTSGNIMEDYIQYYTSVLLRDE